MDRLVQNWIRLRKNKQHGMMAKPNDHSYHRDVPAIADAEDVQTPQKKRRKIGAYCAVAECNSKQADGISLHKFPSDQDETRRQWVRFVQTCRADFGPIYGTPNKYSHICEKHFSQECYPPCIALKKSFGLKTSAFLKPKSVPTIQKPERVLTARGTSCTTSVTQTTVSMSVSTTVTTTMVSPVCSVLPGVSRVRGAYAKRERQRVVADILANHTADQREETCTSSDLSESPVQPDDTTSAKDAAMQTEGCQWSNQKLLNKPMTRSKRVQVYPSTAFKGVQCNLGCRPEMCTTMTQCSLDLDSSYSYQPVHMPTALGSTSSPNLHPIKDEPNDSPNLHPVKDEPND